MTDQTKPSEQVSQIESDIETLRVCLWQSLEGFWKTHGLVPNVEVVRLDKVGGEQVLAAVSITVTIGDPR